KSQYTSVKLRLGARGAAVTYLQQRLNAHGASLKVDGVFGSATLRAVKNRQSSARIGVDGVVGPKTWNALTGSSSSAPSTGSQPKLRQGNRGSAVTTLQKQLNSAGASLTVDGGFGSATGSAVRALQSAAGIGVGTAGGPGPGSAVNSGGSSAGGGGGGAGAARPGGQGNVHAAINPARSTLVVRDKGGAPTPSSGFDCPALVYYAYNQAGMNLPRKTAKGYTFGGRIISKSQAQPGDLVAFTGNDYGHMGI